MLTWGEFSIRESTPSRIVATRCAVATLAFGVLWIGAVDLCAREASKQWIVFQNCRLIPNPANDGDSFHVSVGQKEYLFRLYMVDTPETDEMVPRRLVDQAKYFGITVREAIEVGRAAKEFTRRKLSEPFTVFTHLSDAMGRSRLERFYAYIQTKDGDLGEQLVRSGLARIYGFKAAPPGSGNLPAEMHELQLLESQARQEKIGGWGINAVRLSTPQSLPTIGFSRSYGSMLSAGNPKPKKSQLKSETPLGRIDINTATEEELRTIPGIGPQIAARIIAARPFRSTDDLKRVSGIGDRKYEQTRRYFQ